MPVLLTLPMPAVGLCTDVELYLRMHRGGWYSFADSAVMLDSGDWVSTDTYFGVIPTGKWARHTVLGRVEIAVTVEGDIEVEAVHNRAGHESRIVAVARHVGPAGEAVLVVPELAEVSDGHVFVRVRSRADHSRLLGLVVRTSEEPARDVRLGVSITTFNRPTYVGANLSRLHALLVARPDVAAAVRVQVVDNGRNLALDPASPTRVISNRNLGGAGGFARGLLELRDEGWCTHVLFMDDDVSFEPEVIARIVALLSFARDERLCVCGAMLREEFPHRQFEAGAIVRTHASHIWQAVGKDRDLREWEELLENEADEPFDYGGWWCFAFPVDLTEDYPLPVFVRGDDVLFGIRYATGHMVTMNGIGVWHQDFSHKNGPTAFFYESRNLPIMLTVCRPDYDAGALRKRMLERVFRFASAFKYSSADAVLDGIEAFLDGPEALVERPADELHQEIAGRYGQTLGALEPGERSVGQWHPPPAPLPILWRAASALTVGGHLLPRRLRRRRTWAARADAEPAMSTLGADTIVYRHDPSGTGFVAHRDPEEFRRLMRRVRVVNRRIGNEFDAVADAWRAAYPKLVTAAYWRDQFVDSTPDR